MDKTNLAEHDVKPPSPTEFDIFVPWACHQLQLKTMVVINRTQQQYVSATASDRSKSKTKNKVKDQSQVEFSSELDEDFNKASNASNNDILYINAVYDNNGNVVKIIFDKTGTIPRILFKVIGLIIKFHVYLTTIVINRGIDKYTVYELCKFLPLSNITDICLDGTYLRNASYHLLLEQSNLIRNLSLSRCGIDDVVVALIADALAYPLPASKSLLILNLSSNKITDVGVTSLANALRTNRRLSYLNLSNNMITDQGTACLLGTLCLFPLTLSELIASRSRHISFLKEKSDRVTSLAKELLSNDSDNNCNKRATKQKMKSAPKKSRMELDASMKVIQESNSASNLDAFFDKAQAMVEATVGSFKDPFNKDNTYVKDTNTYCFGNNSLCYLNLSYNNWSYLTLRKLLTVLIYQQNMNRKPRGLVNLFIEGNLLPMFCKELQLIDSILYDSLSLSQRDTWVPKKKTLIKTHK